MSTLRVVAMASGIAALALASPFAQAQTSPQDDPAAGQPDPDVTTPPAQPVETAPVQPELHITTPPPVEVHTPAPVVVPEPAPVIVEERPINLTIVEQDRPRNMTMSLGGGVSNFFDETLQDRAGMQGAYEARLGIGASSLIGLEAAYVGTAGSIDTLGLDDDAMLISNGVEALARVNFGTGDVQPFVVGGGSWMRYNVVNDSFNTSDVRDEDDVIAVPVGAGVAAYLGDSNLVLDGRFIYRATFDDELVRPTPGNSDGSDMNNWVATLRLGYAF
jgi:hypothetical protein